MVARIQGSMEGPYFPEESLQRLRPADRPNEAANQFGVGIISGERRLGVAAGGPRLDFAWGLIAKFGQANVFGALAIS
jgi:hypothetical protein